jgi:hypothetical protein
MLRATLPKAPCAKSSAAVPAQDVFRDNRAGVQLEVQKITQSIARWL